jgi:hypothetical protein
MKNFRFLVITSMMLVALPINRGVVSTLGIDTVNQGGDFRTATISLAQQISRNEARSITVNASGVYVAGGTDGALPGQISLGGFDAFVRKYDHEANELWTRQFGSPDHDLALSITVDASGIYVAGGTDGALPGQSSLGITDAFVRKYDHEANELWTRQFGSPDIDEAFSITVDASGIYVAGGTDGALPGQSSLGVTDAFVRKYNHEANELWTRQFGSQ